MKAKRKLSINHGEVTNGQMRNAIRQFWHMTCADDIANQVIRVLNIDPAERVYVTDAIYHFRA